MNALVAGNGCLYTVALTLRYDRYHKCFKNMTWIFYAYEIVLPSQIDEFSKKARLVFL